MPDKKTVVQEYLGFVDSIHGCYLDAVTGFAALAQEYESIRDRMCAQSPGTSASDFDDAPFIYGTGHPRQPQSKVVHTCTQGEYRLRNENGGQNHIVVGQLCIAHIYNVWEDHYREEFAMSCNLTTKNDVTLDVFADLARYRHAIIHNRGIATSKIAKCNFFGWFKRGDIILLTPQHFEEIVPRIKADLSAEIKRYP